MLNKTLERYLGSRILQSPHEWADKHHILKVFLEYLHTAGKFFWQRNPSVDLKLRIILDLIYNKNIVGTKVNISTKLSYIFNKLIPIRWTFDQTNKVWYKWYVSLMSQLCFYKRYDFLIKNVFYIVLCKSFRTQKYLFRSIPLDMVTWFSGCNQDISRAYILVKISYDKNTPININNCKFNDSFIK